MELLEGVAVWNIELSPDGRRDVSERRPNRHRLRPGLRISLRRLDRHSENYFAHPSNHAGAQ